MTVFTITYNEELMLPHFIAHYRSRFPDCRIVVYDNMSTDRTVEIALAANCEVISYDTDGKLSDSKYIEIKNNCWKGEKEWVIVADCDELLDINAENIQKESDLGMSFILCQGYNMVNMVDDMRFDSIDHAIRAHSYDKRYCFDAQKVKEINYGPGAHECDMSPDIRIISGIRYRCRHYKYISPDYMIARHAAFAARLSDENKAKGWGAHYLYTPEQIRAEFGEARKNAIKIL